MNEFHMMILDNDENGNRTVHTEPRCYKHRVILRRQVEDKV